MIGHYALDSRNRSSSRFTPRHDSAENWKERRPKSRSYTNFEHRVSTVNTPTEQDIIKKESKIT